MLFILAAAESGFLACAIAALATAALQRGVKPLPALSIGLAGCAAFGYAEFWIAWENWAAGAVFRDAFALVILFYLVKVIRERTPSDVAIPLGIFVLASIGMMLLAFVGRDIDHPMLVSAHRWYGPLYTDHELPMMFAQGIMAGHVPSPIIGNILASDRPPLQVGMFLLFGMQDLAAPETVYEATTVALQVTSLIGVWVLARCFGGSRSVAGLAALAAIATPLFLVNAIFTWPKLLGAGLLLAAFGLHFGPDSPLDRRSFAQGGLVGALCGLAMLAHGTTGFALVGFGVTALALWRFASLRYAVAAAVAFLIPVVSWSLYQHFIDPPGTTLMKWHLAGFIEPDGQTLLEALKAGYAKMTWSYWIAIREVDLGQIVEGLWSYRLPFSAALAEARGNLGGAHAALTTLYYLDFHNFVVSCGVLGLSLFVAPIAIFDTRLRSLSVVIFATLAAWICLLYLPAAAAVHQGSYFPELALVVFAVLAAARLSISMAGLLVAAAVSWTALGYIFTA